MSLLGVGTSMYHDDAVIVAIGNGSLGQNC
jgi:hypothetical protein